jgi:hypothetical protein
MAWLRSGSMSAASRGGIGTIRHPIVDAKVSQRPLEHRRPTIGERPDAQSAALELSTATWPIARKRDWLLSSEPGLGMPSFRPRAGRGHARM